MDCLLPEIVDPLYPKKLLKDDIREPERIKQNILAHKDKKKKWFFINRNLESQLLKNKLKITKT